MRRFRIVLVPALLAPLLLLPSLAWGESEAMEDALQERREQVEGEGRAVRREAVKSDRKLRVLEIRRESLEQDLRVGHPFRSRRELRNELRDTESRGRWTENESRRNDFSTRRNRRELRRLQRSRPRG